jgi:hypothetical protein
MTPTQLWTIILTFGLLLFLGTWFAALSSWYKLKWMRAEADAEELRRQLARRTDTDEADYI